MIWEISPDDAGKNFVSIYNTAGEPVAETVGFETALQLVREHNRAVERALAAGLGIAGRYEQCQMMD
ncbi:MAG: hypothetical protein ACK5JF_14420 [Oscillospiraceae bacterium]